MGPLLAWSSQETLMGLVNPGKPISASPGRGQDPDFPSPIAFLDHLTTLLPYLLLRGSY